MRELTINFLLNAVVAYVIATLSFLIGKEIGVASVPTAATAGVLGGIVTAVSYLLGKIKCGGLFDAKACAVQMLAAALFGMLGGLLMLL